jgi:hypothetical protein
MHISKFTLRWIILLSALSVVGAAWSVVRAQSPAKDQSSNAAKSGHTYSPSKLDVPPRTATGGYPFSPYLDAEIADPDVHRVLYADENVMLLEVSNPPGLDVHMHGHPYATVSGQDTGAGGGNPNPAAARPTPAGNGNELNDPKADPTSEYNNMGSGRGEPPKGVPFLSCSTSAPQAPHKPINHGNVPLHFYRMEFRRLDGDDIQTHWKEWYPQMTKPVTPVKDLVPGPALGPNFSEKWPYPIVYDSVKAAPNNSQLLYEDGKLRFIEVTIRPGETTPMYGDPYPAVLAFNTVSDPATVKETNLDPNSELNGQGSGFGRAPNVHDMKVPTCMTTAPRAPHKIYNAGTAPLHYYRIEYKRIDGEDFKTNWQKWYPWMMYMKYMR